MSDPSNAVFVSQFIKMTVLTSHIPKVESIRPTSRAERRKKLRRGEIRKAYYLGCNRFRSRNR
jgi:hypothetical protein